MYYISMPVFLTEKTPRGEDIEYAPIYPGGTVLAFLERGQARSKVIAVTCDEADIRAKVYAQEFAHLPNPRAIAVELGDIMTPAHLVRVILPGVPEQTIQGESPKPDVTNLAYTITHQAMASLI